MPRKSVRSSKPETSDTAAAPVDRLFALGPALDLTAAGELARGLLALRGAPIAIEASEVRHIGGQCGQILVSAAKTWDADRVSFSLVNPSAEFTEGVRLLGLTSALATKEISQ